MKNLNIGDTYYYLSVPNNCNWMETSCKECSYEKEANLENYIYSTDSNKIEALAKELKLSIEQHFKNMPEPWEFEPNSFYHWITTSSVQHIKTIKTKSAAAPTCYECNYFKTEEEAKLMMELIKGIITKYGFRF